MIAPMNAANIRLSSQGSKLPLKVGVTGGIGSGKSVVCRIFSSLGVPVFNADDAAKFVLNNYHGIRQQIGNILGENVFGSSGADTKRIGQIVFSDARKRGELEALLQPLAIEAGNQWMVAQNAPYVIKEAAIFFETGSEQFVNVMVGVSAPVELRIHRAMNRNNSSRERIEKIVSVQMNDDEKMRRCSYVILNDDTAPLVPQVLSIHQQLLLQSLSTFI